MIYTLIIFVSIPIFIINLLQEYDKNLDFRYNFFFFDLNEIILLSKSEQIIIIIESTKLIT